MESLWNWLLSNWGYVTWTIGTFVALLMFASQVTLNDAISNLSAWPPQLAMRLTSLLRFLARKSSTRALFGALLALTFLTGYWYGERSNPPLPPEKIYIPALASTAARTPAQLVPNILPAIPDRVVELGARYLLLKQLIPEAKKSLLRIEETAPNIKESLKYKAKPEKMPPTFNVLSVSNDQKGWSNGLQKIKEINDRAYKNRKIDFDLVPELAIPTLTAPDEDALKGGDGRAIYAYRVFHFQIGNVVKQANSLIEDLEKEKLGIENALRKSAEGADFLMTK